MKNIIPTFICCAISLSVFSQDTIYLNNKNQKVSKIDAEYFKINNTQTKQAPYYDTTYLLNGELKFETIYENNKKEKIIKHSAWYDSGKPYLEINYSKGKKNGEFITYWENGKLRRKDFYEKGELISGNCWNENGNTIPYFEYEKQPEFPGGSAAFISYLKTNISAKNILNKEVIIKFYIDCDGIITDTQLLKKSNDITLDTEVVNAITNMPTWKPAEQDGKKVGVWRTLPLRF
jgi:antitoxin component YwqK of YwqJK toxin-antitoxin module